VFVIRPGLWLNEKPNCDGDQKKSSSKFLAIRVGVKLFFSNAAIYFLNIILHKSDFVVLFVVCVNALLKGKRVQDFSAKFAI